MKRIALFHRTPLSFAECGPIGLPARLIHELLAALFTDQYSPSPHTGSSSQKVPVMPVSLGRSRRVMPCPDTVF